jgi:hypothetical protein
MCFSNLPIEFDEEGDPYLAEEAERVEQPDAGVGTTDGELDVEPRKTYEAIVGDMPPSARKHLVDTGTGSDSNTNPDPETGRDSGAGVGHDGAGHDAAEGD